MRASAGDLDAAGTLLAAVHRSMRAAIILGVTLAVFGLGVHLSGASRNLYVLGLFPLHWFMIGLGTLVPIVAYARVAEFKALEFRLVDGGVHSRDAVIAWEDIAEIYRGGTIYLAQGLIRSGEERILRIVARDGREIKLELRLFGRGSREVAQALASITEDIVGNVLERQRRELDARLAGGERVRFGDELWIGADGVSKRRDDPSPIPLASVMGLEGVDGHLRLHYADPKRRPRSRSLGALQEIANVHLLDWALRSRDAGPGEAAPRQRDAGDDELGPRSD